MKAAIVMGSVMNDMKRCYQIIHSLTTLSNPAAAQGREKAKNPAALQQSGHAGSNGRAFNKNPARSRAWTT